MGNTNTKDATFSNLAVQHRNIPCTSVIYGVLDRKKAEGTVPYGYYICFYGPLWGKDLLFVHYVYFILCLVKLTFKKEEIEINNKELYNLHIQLLDVYEKNKKGSNLYQKDIHFYNRQLGFFCENAVQRIFVLNQLIKLYEKDREFLIKGCSDAYFANSYKASK